MEKRSGRVVGCLLALVLILVTYILQIQKDIELLANFTDIYLFAILLPTLSIAINLIVKGEVKYLFAGSESPRLRTSPSEFAPTPQSGSLNSSVKVFESGIIPDKTIFHRGDWILFRMRFEGTLKEGYRAALATYSDKTNDPIYDLTTLPDIYAKGTLDGYVSFDEQWPWRIPPNAPIGRCELFIAPCTLVKNVPLNLRLRRYPLRLLNSRRIDLAKPNRQAVVGQTKVITLVE